MKVYLLPFDEHKVKFSFDKEELVKAMQAEAGFPYQGILEVEIADELAKSLNNPEELNSPSPKFVSSDYYEKQEAFLDNPPGWYAKQGTSLYVFFDIMQRCYWSPSDNNLNFFYDRDPERYLSKAIEVELSREAYVKIMGFFHCRCENL